MMSHDKPTDYAGLLRRAEHYKIYSSSEGRLICQLAAAIETLTAECDIKDKQLTIKQAQVATLTETESALRVAVERYTGTPIDEQSKEGVDLVLALGACIERILRENARLESLLSNRIWD